jgi:hypothetical protein
MRRLSISLQQSYRQDPQWPQRIRGKPSSDAENHVCCTADISLQVKCSYTLDQYKPNTKPKANSSKGIPYIEPQLNAAIFQTAEM